MNEAICCPACGCDLPTDSPIGLCPACLLTQGMDDPKVAAAPGSPVAPVVAQSTQYIPAPDVLADYFPQMEILETLGYGGMGVVYKARQTKLDRLVALKILRPDSADDPAFAERFNREARTLARLQHPNIVAIHDFGDVPLQVTDSGTAEPGRIYYFVMEYVEGTNLRQLIQAGHLQTDQSLAIVSQICDALQFAHDEHVVHRDIKPENILIDVKGRVKIADFGLAKLAARNIDQFTLTGTHQVMGTPRYMAPEQMQGSHQVDHRADIYALGVVFFEMLTGQVPVGNFDLPSRIAGVHTGLDRVVLQALASEPGRRYQHISQLKLDIASIAGSGVMNSLSEVSPAVAQVGSVAGSQTPSEYDRELARHRVLGPAGALTLYALLQPVIPFAFTGIHDTLIGDPIAVPFVAWISAILIFLSARRFRLARNYDMCIGGCMLAMIPWCPLALIGVPIGVWCLWTLRQEDVKQVFVWEALRQRGVATGALPPPDKPAPQVLGNGLHPSADSASTADQQPPYPVGPSTLIDRGVSFVGRLFRGP